MVSLAFTNGTLLPHYLCGAQGDGYPKAVSTLIPYLQLGSTADTYVEYPPGNSTSFPIQIPGTATTGALAPSMQQALGAFHNGQATAATPYVTGLTNPVQLVPSTANTISGNGNYVISPGQTYTFAAVVNSPAYNCQGVGLVGLFMYALDTGTNQRVGTFINAGAYMTNWSSCLVGTNSMSTSVGIVHTQPIWPYGTVHAAYSGITWQAPATISGEIKFIGAAVTTYGYGAWSTTYNTPSLTVTNPTGNIVTVASANSQGLTVNGATIATAGNFDAMTAGANLIQTIIGGTATTTTTNALQPGVVAAIAIGSILGAVAVAGGVFFYVKKKQAAASYSPTNNTFYAL